MRQSKALGILGKMAPAMIFLLAFSAGFPTQALAHYKPPGCVDTPPYDIPLFKAERFVTVAPGVKLEVLDWGGSGEVMVLLTGSGDNAHVFDYFAFQFTNFFHVIGITRRGWLPSSQPKTGYDVETRAADDIKVLDALGIKKAVFVGHSIAGSELSKIASKISEAMLISWFIWTHPIWQRGTRSLIYQVHFLFLLTRTPSLYLPYKQPMHDCWQSANQSRRPACPSSSTKMEWLRASRHRTRSSGQLSAGVSTPANPPTNWADIKVPRLGIFAPPTAESKLPWYGI